MPVSDVVVVGGGIGGAALANRLARGGLGVTLLEATIEFPDRVRGEAMAPWGVREARNLGVEDALLAAGAHVAPVWKQYSEGIGEAGDIPVGTLLPGIPGFLNIRHPIACQVLVDTAAAAGAIIVRGVRDITITPGLSPTVSYATDDQTVELTATLVVGADGRSSTVRRQAGISLERQEASGYITGLLVDGLDDLPDDHDLVVGEGDVLLTLFHQGGGRARIYLMTGLSGQHRFSGSSGTNRFLTACNLTCYPWATQVAAGTPAGPCATYPGDDTWTDAPFADGVVLIGDAAGHNDPIIGQGLSLALRDARVVGDLVLDGARDPVAFAAYGQERSSIMERVRFAADVMSVAQAEDADNRRARRALVGEKMATMDAEVFPVILGVFIGPETIPQDLLNPELLDRIRHA